MVTFFEVKYLVLIFICFPIVVVFISAIKALKFDLFGCYYFKITIATLRLFTVNFQFRYSWNEHNLLDYFDMRIVRP